MHSCLHLYYIFVNTSTCIWYILKIKAQTLHVVWAAFGIGLKDWETKGALIDFCGFLIWGPRGCCSSPWSPVSKCVHVESWTFGYYWLPWGTWVLSPIVVNKMPRRVITSFENCHRILVKLNLQGVLAINFLSLIVVCFVVLTMVNKKRMQPTT